MSQFCPQCGTKNLDEAKFCKNCGFDMSKAIEQINTSRDKADNNQSDFDKYADQRIQEINKALKSKDEVDEESNLKIIGWILAAIVLFIVMIK